MTQLTQRRTFTEIIRDHHSRIRALERSPGGGGGSEAAGSECARCYFVNPGDIAVDSEFLDCIELAAGSLSFDLSCGGCSALEMDPGTWGFAGFDSNWNAGFVVWVRIIADVVNADNIGINAYVNDDDDQYTAVGNGQVYIVGLGGGAVYNGPVDTGWHSRPYTGSGITNCWRNWFALTMSTYNDVFGATATGTIYWKFVQMIDGDEQTALDDLPSAESYGDTIYYIASENRWVGGARSIPSRAISFFNSVLTSIATRL